MVRNHLRLGIYCITFLLSLGLFLLIRSLIPEGQLQMIRLTQVYAFTALIFLYFTLLASPLTTVFPDLFFKRSYIHARKALGLSAFYFGFLHGTLAFFDQLGGFEGLGFLSQNYLKAVVLGASSLFIFFLMTFVSLKFVEEKVGFARWKLVHRLVYLASIFIMIHALMLGTHFSNLSDALPKFVFAAIALLLTLEAIRLDMYIKWKLNLSLIVATIFVTLVFVQIYSPTSDKSLGIHALHIKLAKEAQNLAASPTGTQAGGISALVGDKTKRYTVSLDKPSLIKKSVDVPLKFEVYDAGSGDKVLLYTKLYEKFLHLIIVDSDLKYFTHIHPTLTENGFEISTQFPHDGVYHLYLDFQPLGAIEQQVAFTVSVGNSKPSDGAQVDDFSKTKIFGTYEVSMGYPEPLKANELSVGKTTLSFAVRDAKTKEGIKTLKPYLASFGHLVMINTKTFDYLHVHPTNIIPPTSNANGGPVVEFLPLGLYGPIKPGTYRVFAQFNPDNSLITTDFALTIE